jgi:acetolactate synthase-1/2/3 large subunit
MTAMELLTAVHENLPYTVIILKNNVLGMVRQWQTLFFDKHYSATTLPAFDFAGFVRSCGASAHEVKTREEFAAAFDAARTSRTVNVIIADIDSDEKVKPMTAPNQSVDEFVLI